MDAIPKFLSGIFSFTGTGLKNSAAFAEPVTYMVPPDKRPQLVFFRGGNSADALVCVVLLLNGKPFRLFPIGAKASIHVPLAVVEDLSPDSKLEAQIAAPEGVTGEIIIDIGLVEI